MGRGRAKAKQTKVARELKYRNHGTDLGQLQRELSAEHGPEPGEAQSVDDDFADDSYPEYRAPSRD